MKINDLIMKSFCLEYAFFSRKFREDFLGLFHRGSKIGGTTVTTDRTVVHMEMTNK